MATYTVNYTRNVAGKWVGRVIPQDTPDTTIETREHRDWSSCVDEVFDLVEADAVVHLGDIAGEDLRGHGSVVRALARNYHDSKPKGWS